MKLETTSRHVRDVACSIQISSKIKQPRATADPASLFFLIIILWVWHVQLQPTSWELSSGHVLQVLCTTWMHTPPDKRYIWWQRQQETRKGAWNMITACRIQQLVIIEAQWIRLKVFLQKLSSALLSGSLEPVLRRRLWIRCLQLLHLGTKEVVVGHLERSLLLAQVSECDFFASTWKQ